MVAVSYLSIVPASWKIKCLPVSVVALTWNLSYAPCQEQVLKATINPSWICKDGKFMQSYGFCDDCAVVYLTILIFTEYDKIFSI